MSGISAQNILPILAIVVGALVAFWIVRKVVKLLLSLLIVAVLAAGAVFYCVKAGYLSGETVEKLNPLEGAAVRQAVKTAEDWAEAKMKKAVKKAIGEAVAEDVAKPAESR